MGLQPQLEPTPRNIPRISVSSPSRFFRHRGPELWGEAFIMASFFSIAFWGFSIRWFFFVLVFCDALNFLRGPCFVWPQIWDDRCSVGGLRASHFHHVCRGSYPGFRSKKLWLWVEKIHRVFIQQQQLRLVAAKAAAARGGLCCRKYFFCFLYGVSKNDYLSSSWASDQDGMQTRLL